MKIRSKMKISKAYLCVNCNEVIDVVPRCPLCQSESVVPLEQWLYRNRNIKKSVESNNYTPTPIKKNR